MIKYNVLAALTLSLALAAPFEMEGKDNGSPAYVLVADTPDSVFVLESQAPFTGVEVLSVYGPALVYRDQLKVESAGESPPVTLRPRGDNRHYSFDRTSNGRWHQPGRWRSCANRA